MVSSPISYLKQAEFAQDLIFSLSIIQQLTTPMVKRFCSIIQMKFPSLGLSTVTSWMSPKLSVKSTDNSSRQFSTHDFWANVLHFLSLISDTQERSDDYSSNIGILLNYCSFSEKEIDALPLRMLLLALPYIAGFLNSAFKTVLIIQLYPLWLHCFFVLYLLESLFYLRHAS